MLGLVLFLGSGLYQTNFVVGTIKFEKAYAIYQSKQHVHTHRLASETEVYLRFQTIAIAVLAHLALLPLRSKLPVTEDFPLNL